MANCGSDLWARILAASMAVLLVGAPALTAVANADNNFSAHLQDKAGSSPVYLADKNDKSGGDGKGDHGGEHGKSGDDKHGSGSSGGDASNDTTASNGSSNSVSDDSGAGATDNHEDETVPASDAEENSTSQVTPVAQQNDDQPESPPEKQAYPEDTYPDSYFSDKLVYRHD